MAVGCDGKTSRAETDGWTDESDGAATDEPDATVTDGDGDGSDVADTAAGAPAPVTLVVETVELVQDRLCDLDGDGEPNNALADLGSPDGEMLGVAINTFLAAAYLENRPLVFHFPLVDDPSGPTDDSALLIVFEGVDDENPRDRGDDYSGEEPFFAWWPHIDACGEPLWTFDGVRMDGGPFETTLPGALFIPMGAEGFALSGARVFGTLEADGAHGEWMVCGFAKVDDLGPIDSQVLEGISVLELLLGGGSAFGLPHLPGVALDVDIDGDGLERFVLDDNGNIETCVDGDNTALEGPDCWQDPRMTDGLGLTLSMTAVSARSEGPEAGWRSQVEGTCDAPPDESLWDPR